METFKNYHETTGAKRKVYFSLIVGVLMLFVYNTTEAQERWSIALGSGVNFPTQDLGDANLRTGFGFEGTVAYRFMPNLSVYTGWGWNKFTDKHSFAGDDADFEETGYTLGVRFNHAFASTNLDYILGLGGIYNHIEIEDDDGDNIADSGHGFGVQADAGISIPLSDRFAIIDYREDDLFFLQELGKIAETLEINIETIHVAPKDCLHEQILHRGLITLVEDKISTVFAAHHLIINKSFFKGVEEYLNNNPNSLLAMAHYRRMFLAGLLNNSVTEEMAYHTKTPLLIFNQ